MLTTSNNTLLYTWNIHELYTNLVHPLHYFPSHPITLLKVTLTDLMFHIHIFIESTSTIYSPSFTLFIYSSLPKSALPLSWTILHSWPSLFKSLFFAQWGFCIGMLPVNILCLNKPNFLHYYSPPFLPLLCIAQQFSVCSVVSYSYTDVMYFTIFHSIILLFLLP
jgi:hypothetical protein